MRRKIVAAVVFAALVVLAAITVSNNKPVATDNQKINVAVSFYPLEDFSRAIGGDHVVVANLTAAGAEPHDYEPPAKDLARAQKADVFVYNGASFEPWVAGFLQDYKGMVIKSSDGVDLLGGDPHFWLDPVRSQKVVAAIRDGFIKADPANKDLYSKNADDYTRKLKALDAEFREGLATCSQRVIISSHNAFSYPAQRYNFTVESIAGISPEEEPSPERLAELSRIVKEKGITYVFFESLVSPRLADTIAKEAGVGTLVLDPLEGMSNEDQQQGRDYLSVQHENLENLRRALACR